MLWLIHGKWIKFSIKYLFILGIFVMFFYINASICVTSEASKFINLKMSFYFILPCLNCIDNNKSFSEIDTWETILLLIGHGLCNHSSANWIHIEKNIILVNFPNRFWLHSCRIWRTQLLLTFTTASTKHSKLRVTSKCINFSTFSLVFKKLHLGRV